MKSVSIAAVAALATASTAVAQPFAVPIGSYAAPGEVFDESAAEIVAFDAASAQLFVVNGATTSVDVLSIADPTMPSLVASIALPTNPAFGGVQSVAVSDSLIAVAIENDTPTDNGFVGLFDLATFDFVNSVEVGALPDSLAFTPDGGRIVVANEGEATDGDAGELVLPGVAPGPGQSVAANPDGTLSVIDVSGGAASATVTSLDFSSFLGELSSANSPLDSVRINPIAEATFGGPLSDLEPEFVAISDDGQTAYVSLQENNTIAVVDLSTSGAETITDLLPLGAVDHSVDGSGLDGRDNDGVPVIEPQPIFSLFMPDGIATYEVAGETFIVTANEGDGRADDDFGGLFQDFDDLDELGVDPGFDPNINDVAPTTLGDFLDNDNGIGDLEISSIDGDTDGDGDLDQLFAFGSRSFSIFDTDGNLVFNSGDDFEQAIAQAITDGTLPPSAFNTDNDSNSAGENRSDDAGPEPEGVTIGVIDGRTVAFIGVERVGGFFVYDITDPENAEFIEYINPRDFTFALAADLDDDDLVDAADDELEAAVNALSGTLTSDLGALDLGPEGILFIDAADSPIGVPLLVVTNEVSGTTTIYQVPEPTTLAAVGAGLLCLAARRRRHA